MCSEMYIYVHFYAFDKLIAPLSNVYCIYFIMVLDCYGSFISNKTEDKKYYYCPYYLKFFYNMNEVSKKC